MELKAARGRGRGCVRGTPAVLLCLLAVVLCRTAGAIRKVREKVQLTEATGEANPRIDHLEFDPVLAELEQEQDDKKWMENYKRAHDAWTSGHVEQAMADGGVPEDIDPAWAEAGGATMAEADLDLDDLGQGDPVSDDFLMEDHFNISDRIIKLFPLIDSSPKDERISLEEMLAWHVRLGQQASMHRTEREMEAADADADGAATLQEALTAMGVGDPNDESTAEQRALYTERFHVADTNKDSLLNLTEFNDFLHPEETDNEELQLNVARDEMRHRDMDGDGKLTLSEYEMNTHHEVAHLMAEYKDPAESMEEHFEEGHQEDHDKAKAAKAAEVQSSFGNFDKDLDGFIDLQEFRAIVRELWPSQREFAKYHSKDIVEQADGNKDGFLTVQEMLVHPHAFYQTVEDPREQPMHDEF